MAAGIDTETAAYLFAGGAFIAGLVIHALKRRTLFATALIIALLTLAVLFATAWRGVWREQELWAVGALFAFAMFLAAAAAAAMIVRLAAKLRRTGQR